MMNANERLEALKAAGIDTSNYIVLSGADGQGYLFKNDNGTLTQITEEIKKDIDNGGYIYNRYTAPRWIPAMMFAMINSADGYNKELTKLGYKYQFLFLGDEIHRLAKKEKDNDPTFKMRAKFLPVTVVVEILQDYVADLQEYIDNLEVKRHNGMPYKRIKGFKYSDDGKGDVYISKIEKKVMNPIRVAIDKMGTCDSYSELDRVYSNFLHKLYINIDANQSKAFKDIYKGRGAYYTCESLIKWHGCSIEGVDGIENNMAVLDAKVDEYKGEFYKLYAFMNKLIKDNNFTPDWR